jgi:two-component system, NarL family, sensor kinase
MNLLQKTRSRSKSDEIVQEIKRGGIDALVTKGRKGHKTPMPEGADHPYRLLVETVHDGAATLDSSGTILYANKRFAEILGVPVESLIGASLQRQISASASEKLGNLIREVLRGNRGSEVIFETRSEPPRTARFAFTLAQNMERPHICVVATELTELLEVNKALTASQESLRQLSSRLMQLQDEERRRIARDLHDITGQKLVAESMALAQIFQRNRGRIDEDSRRMLLECSMMTKDLIEEIRTLSYLLHPPLLDELGLAAAVKWYAEGFQRRTNIATEVEVASEVPRMSPDQEMALFRVLQESLTNVHRYSGSSKARIEVSFDGDNVRLQVSDFGKGIKPKALDSIKQEGSALGVGIRGMRERMRQLAGRLEISSRPGHGTRVVAILPRTETQPVAQASPEVASSKEAPVAKRRPQRRRKRKQILIADDHEMLRRGVQTMLESETDWEVCGEAVDGKDAVDKVVALDPDLVILDINMPVLNGLAAARQILRERPQTKILVFTVHESDQTLKEIQASGAHGYLPKSRAGQDLLRMAREILEGKNVRAFAATSSSS